MLQNFFLYRHAIAHLGLTSFLICMGMPVKLKLLIIIKESLIKSVLNFSGDKFFQFKAQIEENSLLFSRFATKKRNILALKKQFMTYSEVP
ncbi:hypothetical protein JYT87_03360 [Nitrospira defluvii]|nr:hypothetical protein [Nitrospira defluvii]